MAISDLSYFVALKETVEHEEFEEVIDREEEVKGFIDAHFHDPSIPIKIWVGVVNCAKVKDGHQMAITWNGLMQLALVSQ